MFLILKFTPPEQRRSKICIYPGQKHFNLSR